MKNEEKLVRKLVELGDPVAFFGIARILKVPLHDDSKVCPNGKPPLRQTDDLFCDIIDFYAAAPSKRQREILKVLDEALKEKKKDGRNSKDPETEN